MRRGLRRALGYGVYCVIVFALVFGLAEWVARARGEQPWRPGAPGVRVDPGGRLYQPDPLLGYRMLPGRYAVRFENGAAFRVTHGADTLRVTRPDAVPGPGRDGLLEPGPADLPELWIFGCSFSYGWGIDDEAVYAWRLQEQLPGWRVVNHSVNGYGTLQSLLALERALEQGRAPAVVVLAYAAFHDERNTFVRARRKRVAPFSSLGPLVQPYARLRSDAGPEPVLDIEMAAVAYREWPGMRHSALVHVAEQRWNEFERIRADSAGVTRALVARFIERGRAVGARVLVAGIAGRTDAVLGVAAANGATPVPLAIDLDRPGMRNPPPDGHPSAQAHRLYAQRLLRAVRAFSD